MNTYGMHSIHGRAPAVATGLAVTWPDLDVWVITGTESALDRRQPPHPRPAAERGHHDPAVQQPDLRPHEGPVFADIRAGQGDEVNAHRVPESPFNPISLALGAEATFVARTLDMDPKHMQATFRRPATRALPSSRSTRTATSSTTGRSSSPRSRPPPATLVPSGCTANPSGSCRPPARSGRRQRGQGARSSTWPTWGEDALTRHQKAADDPGSRSSCRG